MIHMLVLVIGIAIGANVVHGRHLRWQEAHYYRLVAASDDRIRNIAAAADHDHRNAVRWEQAVTALQEVHADVVGDLLDTVAEQRVLIDELSSTGKVERESTHV